MHACVVATFIRHRLHALIAFKPSYALMVLEPADNCCVFFGDQRPCMAPLPFPGREHKLAQKRRVLRARRMLAQKRRVLRARRICTVRTLAYNYANSSHAGEQHVGSLDTRERRWKVRDSLQEGTMTNRDVRADESSR
jgi:hypothetical protein